LAATEIAADDRCRVVAVDMMAVDGSGEVGWAGRLLCYQLDGGAITEVCCGSMRGARQSARLRIIT
jgi:hypothetical protein